MDSPKYFIINPLQILLSNKINNKTNNKTNKKLKLSEIEERFYNKMEKLKNINLQNEQIKKNLILVSI